MNPHEGTVLMSSTVAKDAFEIGSCDLGDPRGVGARCRCITGEGGSKFLWRDPLRVMDRRPVVITYRADSRNCDAR